MGVRVRDPDFDLALRHGRGGGGLLARLVEGELHARRLGALRLQRAGRLLLRRLPLSGAERLRTARGGLCLEQRALRLA